MTQRIALEFYSHNMEQKENPLEIKVKNNNSGKEGHLSSLFFLPAIMFSVGSPAIVGFKASHNHLEDNPELFAKTIAQVVPSIIIADCMGAFGAYIDKKGTGRYALGVFTALQAASYGIGYGIGKFIQ